MSDKFRLRWEGSSIWVILFGIFVVVSLFLQCLVPFLMKYNGFATYFVNMQFVLPMDVITSFWAAISAAYIGVDRAAMTISTVNGEYNKLDKGNPEHNRHIIIESFIIYSVATALNIIFDAQLSLTPLATSLGASVLLYVSGQKAIYAASKIAPEGDSDSSGIPDVIEDKIRELIKDNKHYIISTIQEDGRLKKEIEG
ncbi:MAG: hypothetical protein LBD41_04335 [Clostridiales Family XIII bacterium]|jgi:hypothetical protein|nr:hypothetical protein [Clostridiales Family XIII bacterium]